MPPYPWMATDKVDLRIIPSKIRGMITLGVPYPPNYEQLAVADYKLQAAEVVETLKQSDITIDDESQMVALIAYLQRMGTDIKVKPPVATEVTND